MTEKVTNNNNTEYPYCSWNVLG